MILAMNPQTPEKTGEDFSIIRDEVVDGIRYVTATPSAKVCSKQIDLEIEVSTHKILAGKFTRGCSGNAQGICALIKDMTTEEAARRLEGINCAGRGTSCPDQLAKVLKSLKW